MHIAISLHAKPIRKLILLLLSGMLSTACVDKDYDLGNIDTDNIPLGKRSPRIAAYVREGDRR